MIVDGIVIRAAGQRQALALIQMGGAGDAQQRCKIAGFATTLQHFTINAGNKRTQCQFGIRRNLFQQLPTNWYRPTK